MALQHLRSSTANKRPTPGAMSDGQLALNTNLASPGLFFKDSNGDSVKIGPVHVGTTAPNVTPGAGGQAGNSKGEAWLDTTAANPILKVWNGSAFVAERLPLKRPVDGCLHLETQRPALAHLMGLTLGLAEATCRFQMLNPQAPFSTLLIPNAPASTPAAGS
jgi:hypothetical protein